PALFDLRLALPDDTLSRDANANVRGLAFEEPDARPRRYRPGELGVSRGVREAPDVEVDCAHRLSSPPSVGTASAAPHGAPGQRSGPVRHVAHVDRIAPPLALRAGAVSALFRRLRAHELLEDHEGDFGPFADLLEDPLHAGPFEAGLA